MFTIVWVTGWKYYIYITPDTLHTMNDYINFIFKCQGIKLNVNINNVDLPCGNSTKILGVHFDATLSWKDHVKHVGNKIYKNLFLLKSIKCFLPLNARKLLYDSYILPYFDFCSIICRRAAGSHLDPYSRSLRLRM